MTWGAAFLVASCIAMLVATQLYFAYDVDRDARRQSEMIVNMAVTSHAASLQNELLPQTYWDDAVINLDNRLDPKWARMMIGNYFVASRGMDVAAVFDRADQLVMSQGRLGKFDRAHRPQLSQKARAMIAEVRQGERKRGPLPRFQPEGASVTRISSWDVTLLGGQPFLMAAGLVQPDQMAHPLTSRSAVAVIGKRLDQAFIDAIAAEHHIKGMRFIPATGKPPAE